jgi:hypothetical protein
MKKIFLFTFCSALFFLAQAQQSSGENIAQNISRKLTDSLGLSQNQKQQIDALNLQLAYQKAIVWQNYKNADSLRKHLQMIENSRDSLYGNVLTEQQAVLYKQKKRNLITGN